MRTLILLTALAAMASAQFKPYNPISVEIEDSEPLRIPDIRPAAPRPAPRPAAPPTRPPLPPSPPSSLGGGGAGGRGPGAGGLGAGGRGPGAGSLGAGGAGAGGAGGRGPGAGGLGAGGLGAGGAGSGSGSGNRGAGAGGSRGSGSGSGLGSGGLGGAGGTGGSGGASGAGAYADLAGGRGPPITVAGSLRSGTGSAEPRNGQGGLWTIIRQNQDVHPTGYQWNIETENGIGAREDGDLQNPGREDESMLAKGYYEFTAPDGILYRVDYVADDYGFRAIGAHLPAPPPIPDVILRSIEYNRLHAKDSEQDNRRFARK